MIVEEFNAVKEEIFSVGSAKRNILSLFTKLAEEEGDIEKILSNDWIEFFLPEVGIEVRYELPGFKVYWNRVETLELGIRERLQEKKIFRFTNVYSTREEFKVFWRCRKGREKDFVDRKLKAFGLSYQNFIDLVSYSIFFNMLNHKLENNSGDVVLEERKKFYFESGKPTAGCQNHLEEEEKEKERIKVAIEEIRQQLTENKESWISLCVNGNVGNIPLDEDKKSFIQKIEIVAENMEGSCLKYRKCPSTNDASKFFDVWVKKEDLVLIGNSKWLSDLEDQFKKNLVGKIIKVSWFPPGEALILHENAVKFFVFDNSFEIFTYKDPINLFNISHTYRIFLDICVRYPHCYICPKRKEENL